MKHCFNNRTHFSLGTSIIKPKDLVKKAKELGYESVAVIDNATLSGMTHLFTACKEHDIKGVCGINIRVFDDPSYRPPSKSSGKKIADNFFWEAKLIVKNEIGLKALFKLLSQANDPHYFYYTPRIGLKELILALKSDGLILLTGDFFPLFSHHNYEKIYALICKHVKASNRFIELIPISSAYFDKINKIASDTAHSTESKVIYSRPALYFKDDDVARDVMSYIYSNSSATHRLRNEPFNRDLHILEKQELSKEIEQLKRKLTNTCVSSIDELINICTYEWHKQDMCLPKMADDEFAELVRQCKVGWEQKLKVEIFGYKPDESLLPLYKKRLKYELTVLKNMKFDRYFLLVADVMNWCKEKEILTAPGRGSAAGSLVAYLLNITNIDPIRFNLIFERFLNPERLDYPDVDSDFMSSRRHEVIDYITNKYGKENVAGISNYTALGAASAIRDVARVNGLKPEEYKCSKSIELGMNLELAIELPEIEQYAQDHEDLFNQSLALEGCLRSLGRHAAGIVVGGEPLLNRCAVEHRKGEITVNWDKRTVEDWGLIKLDILGLSTLDVLALVQEKVKKRHSINIDWNKIPLDDERTLKSFSMGQTIGVFQFGSGGMRKLLKSIGEGGRRITFEDLYAATALYRPGPLESGMTDSYVKIKQGITAPEYIHNSTESALLTTKGIMIYQEQTMQIARDVAGFTMAESDLLRKGISKKDKVLIDKLKEQFVEGAKKGWVTVELDDGTRKRVHRNTKHPVKNDAKLFLTVEEAIKQKKKLIL